MRKFLEKLFPVLSKNETVVEKSWNLYDLSNLLELWVFLLIKTVLGTCLSVVLEILKFILILLITYALALGLFNFMERILEDNTHKTSYKKSQGDFGLRRQKSSDSYPYIVNYASKSEEENSKSRSAAGPYQISGLDSDTSDNGVVRMGSFKRPSTISEGGETSIIGRAIEELQNARTAVNENETKVTESNHSRETKKSGLSIDAKSTS